MPFLGALAGCSARRSERRVASHTSEEQRRNAPGSAAKNGILAFPASLSNRRALKASRIGDVEVPQGSLLTLCIGAANRDPAQFSQPDRLDLTRQNNRHLAFGFGIHQCAGLSLARLEGRIALGRFLRRFPGYRLTGTALRGGRARFRGFLQAPFSVG